MQQAAGSKATAVVAAQSDGVERSRWVRGVSRHESHWKSTSGGVDSAGAGSEAAGWRAVKFRFTFEIVAKWKSLSRMPHAAAASSG